MFIVDYPVMFVDDALVVADLHIGITKELYDRGVSIPSQVRVMAERINKLKKDVGAKQLIILGDIKHKVPGVSWQELREVPEFLSLLKFRKIVIIKGNHDGNIEDMVGDRALVRKSFSLSDYYFTHGHMKANTDKETIVIGHNHPFIMFKDDLGAVYTEPVWVIGKTKIKGVNHRLIIVPAFNELCGAVIVNRDTLLGPIAKKISSAHAFLLDGTDLGLIKDLKLKR